MQTSGKTVNKHEITDGWSGILVLALFAAIGGYIWLDSIGWISHRESTVISVRGDWLTGESKQCWSPALDSERAASQGEEAGYALSRVFCDDGPEHTMEVAFYGQKVQREYSVVLWRCVRSGAFFGGDSFICYQTGGRR
jgi:hypothetical protein